MIDFWVVVSCAACGAEVSRSLHPKDDLPAISDGIGATEHAAQVHEGEES